LFDTERASGAIWTLAEFHEFGGPLPNRYKTPTSRRFASVEVSYSRNGRQSRQATRWN
jgi:hypothetical protein